MPINGKQILITTESHEVFVVRRSREYPISGRCPSCGCEIEPGTAGAADDIVELALRELQGPSDEESERKY